MTIDELNALTTLTATDEVPVWDKEASGEPTKKITASNLAASVKSLASLPNTTEMNDAIAQSTASIVGKSQRNTAHTITFSGEAITRTLYGFLCVVGQSGLSELIPFSLGGDAIIGPATVQSVHVGSNSSGITATGKSINIPEGIGGNWGSYSLILLYHENSLSIQYT